MSLRSATTFALIATLLLTILLAIDFVDSVVAVVRGLIPAIAVLRAFVFFLAGLAVAVFFYVFRKRDS
jgi:hypothetical protein